MLKEGRKAPSFCLKNQNDEKVCLKDFEGKWVVLYFYPKDNTSGCTKEAQDFSNALPSFDELGAVILGVSPDSTESHRKFIEKKGLKITLLSDPEHKVAEKYGVWQLKKTRGKEYYGIVRSTFIIDPDQRIRYAKYKVKVQGHVEEVLNKLKELVG